VLAWLLGEPAGEGAREILASEDQIVSSELTAIECDHVLIRALHLGELTEASVAERRARLNNEAAHWSVLGLTEDVVARARRPFPGEPIRTLDAIHLATALHARAIFAQMSLLSLDQRIRTSAAELGLALLPR
jgi:predicted nucleic acid-binding protein